MARLKNTYIEGDLSVEGNILLNSISTPEGHKFPYVDNILEDTPSYQNRISKFTNNKGGLSPTSLTLKEENQTILNVNPEKQTLVAKLGLLGETDTSVNDLLIDIFPSNIYIKRDESSIPGVDVGSTDIEYDPNLDKWFFKSTGKYDKY